MFFVSDFIPKVYLLTEFKDETKLGDIAIMRGHRIEMPSDFQFSSVAQSCPTLCNPMDCSTPGFPVHHQLLEFTQTHVHWVSDAIHSSHPLSSPSPAFNLSQHQGLFKWVSSSHQVAEILEFQLQHQMKKKWKQWQILFSWAPKSLQTMTAMMKLKDASLLLGIKAITNLDSILKSRDVTLLTKVLMVKVMVFPVVIYGCESWTIKKAECQRTDAFEQWCWRRLLRFSWTAGSNQSVLKEINPEYSS